MTRRDPSPLSALPTRDECLALAKKVLGMVALPSASVDVSGYLDAGNDFARGDTTRAWENNQFAVSLVAIRKDGKAGYGSVSQIDDAGLRRLVQGVEKAAAEQGTPYPAPAFPGPSAWVMGTKDGPVVPTPPKTFFDAVPEAMAPEARVPIFEAALDATEAKKMVAAGTIMFNQMASGGMNSSGLEVYQSRTYGELSVTARTREDNGSGWAWGGFEDWSRVDPKAVIARAVDLAERSKKPVAIEPGRYTVILEPTAVAALIEEIGPWTADGADSGATVFSKQPIGTNKIGLQMMDRRLGLISDPWDPDMPRFILGPNGTPYRRADWFGKGILTNLEYDFAYAKRKNVEVLFDPGGRRLTFDGPTQSLEEMIASTKRGLWVNRLSSVAQMNRMTILCTGTTRDGTFLIENGKITKAVKNFRFTESPFFVFNKLEAAGEAIRASKGIVAPRLKLRDFDMTSLTDAI